MTRMPDLEALVLIRLPERCESIGTWSAFPAISLGGKSVFYSGVDCMRWWDIETDFYNKTLPTRIRDMYKKINDYDSSFGMSVCRDLKLAKTMLDYCNRHSKICELIYISRTLRGDSEVAFSNVLGEWKWIGFDVLSFGFWSLVNEGVFRKPDAFPEFLSRLTDKGLLPSEDAAFDVARSYESLTANNVLEPLPVAPNYGENITMVGAITPIRVAKLVK